jgi:signal transduction histidine kinase
MTTRLLPQSLFGRMVIVLVAGLLTAQVVTLVILLNERSRVDLDARTLRVAQRISDMIVTFDALTPGDRAILAPLISTRTFTVAIAPTDAGAAARETESDYTARAFAAALRKTLGADRLVATGTVGAAPAASATVDDLRASFSRRQAPALFAHARQDDRSLLYYTYMPPSTVGGYPPRVVYSLLVQLIIIVILTLVAVRWATRPLSDLAAAAEKIGAGGSPELDEAGPTEVREAARAFNRMQTRIATYVRDRTRLLAAISHDLKTPITRLRLRSELLADDALREKYVRDLEDMEAMVGRALEFAKGHDVREPSQPINVTALVESLQDDYREAGADVNVEGSARSFVGRPLAIKQALRNLIDNAVKYGGRARIIVADGDDALTIRIRDGGRGIPEDMLERVFDPFFRLEESRNPETGGTGLGLSIARNIADLHAGTLTLRNAEGGGLEATLVLPRVPAKQGGEGPVGSVFGHAQPGDTQLR